jgi:hypothetical protein
MERKGSDLEGTLCHPFQRNYLQPAVGLRLVHRYFLGALASSLRAGQCTGSLFK